MAIAILMAIAFCVYANTFGNAWTHDDFPVVVNNPDIRSLSAFIDNSFPGRPLREVSYLLDYALFGLEPAGYHIQSIFWHGLNAFLIFVLVLKLAGKRRAAWIAALLFLVHPLQVESVANISNRKESLTLAFCLLSTLAYTKVFESGRRRIFWIFLSALLGLVAFTAKQVAVALPPVLIAYELVFVPKEKRLLARWPRLWAIAVASGGVAFWAWYVFYGDREIFLLESLLRLQRFDYTFSAPTEAAHLAMVLKSAGFMFAKLVVPVGLAPEYAYTLPLGWSDPWTLAALGGLILYGLAVCFSFRRQPLTFFALVWLLAFWLPVSNLWPFGYFAADRYLYAPSAGFAIVASLLLVKFVRRPIFFVSIVLTLSVSLSILTWRQNRIWHSSKALWAHTVEVSPRSSHANGFLGMIYMDEGNMEKAFEFHLRAIATNPFNAVAHLDLGRIYERRGNREAAIVHYLEFLRINNPKYRSEAEQVRKHLRQWYGIHSE